MSKSKQELNRDLQDWRISQVLDYLAKGLTQVEISRLLKVHESTISRDVTEIKKQAQLSIKQAIEDQIPTTWYKTKAALQAVQRESWSRVLKENTTNRDKLAALALFKECAQADYVITTDSTVINEALKLINKQNDHTSNRVS
jgi:IS30 family transposase